MSASLTDAPRDDAALRPGLSTVELTDLLLLGLLRRGASAFFIEPRGGRHTLVAEQSGANRALGTLPSALGDAVVARLAILGALDIAGGVQLGRLTVRSAAGDRQLLVSFRPTADGLAAEVRRMAAPDDDSPTEMPAKPEAPEGSQRIGVYRVFGEIGRGGMGIVYRGEHTVINRPVAIKVLPRRLARNTVALTRFLREARAASRARHPGIVDVTDFGLLADGRAFLVMELIEAPTLAEVLEGGALKPARAAVVARHIAGALEPAHAAGVVHRDLKPGNVFLLEEDRVKICDFGLAQVSGSEAEADASTAASLQALPPSQPPPPNKPNGKLTRHSMVVGTPAYMAPEQTRGAQTDHRVDLYSLGCVLFELLTGFTPFQGESDKETMVKQVMDPVPPVVSPHGPLPEILEQAVIRLLAKRPEERHQSARELIADLDRAVEVMAREGWRRWLPR